MIQRTDKLSSEIVAFYFATETPSGFPFNNPVYRTSYARFAMLAKTRGLDLRIILGAGSYAAGKFTEYWYFENDTLQHVRESFRPSLLCLRTRTDLFDHERRVNNPFLEKICQDKLQVYAHFQDFVKKSLPISPTTLSVLSEIDSDPVVIKPRFGSGGDRVQIIRKSEITPDTVADGEYIVQEVIESKSGIAGVVSQRHELRLYLFNGMIKAGYIRLPAKDSYLSNISQGATEMQIRFNQIPESAHDVAKYVDNLFTDITPRMYTLDLMYEDAKPWIVELNDQPGMPDIMVQPLTDTFFKEFLDLLANAIMLKENKK